MFAKCHKWSYGYELRSALKVVQRVLPLAPPSQKIRPAPSIPAKRRPCVSSLRSAVRSNGSGVRMAEPRRAAG